MTHAGSPTDGNAPSSAESQARRDDAALANAVSTLLRRGVIASATLAAIGGALLLIQFGANRADYSSFHGGPPELTDVRRILASALSGHGASIAQLGLVVLIATPIARVGVTFVSFLRRRDRLYALLTGIVLTILLFSFVFGH